jgi:uncharacterized integral membrane protein (TIGR00698 family)
MSERTGYLSYLSDEAFASLGAMDGLVEPIAGAVERGPVAAPTTARLWPGMLAATIIAAVAYGISYLPVAPFRVVQDGLVRHPIDAAILAILLGLLIRNLVRLPPGLSLGCRRIVRQAIPAAIVLVGATLDMSQFRQLSNSLTTLAITFVCVIVAVAAGYFGGRLMGLRPQLAMLLGAGTGICGNSAIVAIAPLIDAEDEDLILSIGTVNLMGLIVMLLCPVLGSMLGLSQWSFGVWAGTSIHAVPQVVAAGFAYGADAGALATLVKLVRVTMLAPLVFVVAFVVARRRAAAAGAEAATTSRPIVHYARLVPWFVWGFVLFALMGTLGFIPTLSFDSMVLTSERVDVSLVKVCKEIGKALLTLAMASLGLEVDLRVLVGVSMKALVAGLIASLALLGTSLALVMLAG